MRGRGASVDTRGTETRIWVHELRSGTTTAISDPGVVATYPIWSPDGKRIAMAVQPAGLWLRASDGTGPAERLTTSRWIPSQALRYLDSMELRAHFFNH